MDAEEKLEITLANRRKERQERTSRLGDVLQSFVEKRLAPQQRKFGDVGEVWGRLLPAGLAKHCQIAGVGGGQLKVRVDSPAYMYELRLCSSELVNQLREECPRAGITRIKFVMG